MKVSRFLRSRVLCCLLVLSSASAYEALEGPTEMLYWDPGRAYNGYTLFGVRGTTYLLDMEGRVVRTWRIGTNPHLLDDGHVLDAATDDPSGFGGFKELDWNGAIVWQYTDARSTHHPHHDFTRIFNPKLQAYTTLYIANKDLTAAQCLAAGATNIDQKSGGIQMDAIVEVDMAGKVVWEWCFFDHLVQDVDPTKSNYAGAGKTIADCPGQLNINLPGKPLRKDWLHCNSLDYNADLDQIVINSVQGEFYVIDHGGTFIADNPTGSMAKAAGPAGDFLYRFGDPARYAQGDPPAIMDNWTQSTNGHKQLGGSHGVQWIGPGLPGAGHFLIFDNGQYLSEHTPQSYILEIDPFLNTEGNNGASYVNPPAAGYNLWGAPAVTDKTPKWMSKQIVWSHSSLSNLTLFSHIGCSAQRLPNGNTLICADTEGYITEVTADGRVVWEYIVPVTPKGSVLVIGDNLPMVNSIFRAYRYGPDHPALAGRTLTGSKTIAGRTTVENPYAGTDYQALQRPTELQYWDPAKAYEGHTLFAAQGTSYLIDMNGRLVRTWPIATNPRLLANGNLLDIAADVNGLVELDWNGNIVWQHDESRSLYHLHGDFARIFNKKLGAWTTLYLAGKDLTHDQCIAAGCDPANGPYIDARTETIIEVDASGNVVWEWCFFDHAVQDVDASKANYVGAGKKITNYPGRINLNLPGRPVRSDWIGCNSIDHNPDLDQIVVNCEWGELYVIDHGGTFVAGDPAASIAKAATSAGDFLYRFGDPAMYGQGNPPSVQANWDSATNGHKQIGASNNVQWIQTGLPGAGHLLVFSNNQYLFQRTPQSYVLEINPFVGANGTDTGAYVNPPTAGYTQWTFDKDTHKSTQQLSRQVVWKYGSLGNLTLFSHFGSSAQRLPNGNTLICATTQGYMVEVTSAGQVVWEYICPVTGAGAVPALGDHLPMTNAVPRAYRYGLDFAGFQGRDMTAGATIAGRTNVTSLMPTHKSGTVTGIPKGGVAGPVGGLVQAVFTCLAAAAPQTPVRFDVLLGQPTDRSIALSVLSDVDLEAFVEYGTQSGVYSNQTSQTTIVAGMPTVLLLDALQPDRQYYYRLQYREPGATSFEPGSEASFHTQRRPGSAFQFAVEADPHHQDNDPVVYQTDLANVAADQPDFLIDLGDTFMTEKFKVGDYAGAVRLCKEVRTGFHSIVGPSVPLFLANGNHEAELGWCLNSMQPQDNIAVWATQARQLVYPCPVPGEFYSGSTVPDSILQKPRDSFYAFEWGDALFVILDPFWYTRTKPKDGWTWTLGMYQYQWLERTLAQSKATFKFVFLHHLAGGSFDGIGRGGKEFASFFEWGGHNQDGTWGFTAKRPGWSMPIQDLLLKYGVNIVFHGHDHFFGKQDLDADGDGVTNIIYQEVPQPGRPGRGDKTSAANYGYADGIILGNSGHLRVQVTSTQARVEYVRAVLPADESPQLANRMISYDYTLTPQPAPSEPQPQPQPQPQPVVPEPVSDRTVILGRPTDRSVTANVLAPTALQVYIEYGPQSSNYLMQTPVADLSAGLPLEMVLNQVQPDSLYYYRLQFKAADETMTPATPPASTDSIPRFVRIPAGQFAMGDHHSFVDPAHPSDEVPIHTVSLDSFWMGTTPVTCGAYCAYLNAALAQGLVEVRSGYVYGVGGTEIYSDTSVVDPASRIEWTGMAFAVRDQRDLHPITGVRWFGAAAYCNWASTRDGYEPCYDLTTGACDFTCDGYRLPTEAEWEYAARGGQHNPYCMFPWGDDTNADGAIANWPGSGDPYETGPYPWTTPAGFYSGQLHSKADFAWPGTQETYQTRSNANGYGLYDMSGNVWQWVNDWYARNYYQYCVTNNIVAKPPGPLTGDPMPDGKRYRGLRGGNWYNGQDQYGHGRVANRDPSYYRGPGDPAGPWFHVGFRVVRRFTGVIAPGAALQQIGRGYLFTEGPAANAAGEIYFSDMEANTIYKWTDGATVTVLRTDSGGANGLYFDTTGNLLICQGMNKRLVSMDMTGGVTIVADRYNGKPFNKPNDLWVAPDGGIYFTDPLFGAGTRTQDGEHVYYVSPSRTSVTRVISDMVRPNGIIGTQDGQTLYVADYGASKVYRYSVNSDGSLSNKTLFASVVCDGMTLDNEGNVYMASDGIVVCDSFGRQIERIDVPEQPTNLTFGGADGRTLFITARTTIYTLSMSVHGAQAASEIAKD